MVILGWMDGHLRVRGTGGKEDGNLGENQVISHAAESYNLLSWNAFFDNRLDHLYIKGKKERKEFQVWAKKERKKERKKGSDKKRRRQTIGNRGSGLVLLNRFRVKTLVQVLGKRGRGREGRSSQHGHVVALFSSFFFFPLFFFPFLFFFLFFVFCFSFSFLFFSFLFFSFFRASFQPSQPSVTLSLFLFLFLLNLTFGEAFLLNLEFIEKQPSSLSTMERPRKLSQKKAKRVPFPL